MRPRGCGSVLTSRVYGNLLQLRAAGRESIPKPPNFSRSDASEYMNRLRRDEVLAVLRHHKAELAERYGVISLGVFGSVARDEAKEYSDVDKHWCQINCTLVVICV